MIPSIAEDTASFSVRKGLESQLETPNPASYMNNEATSKTKPEVFSPPAPNLPAIPSIADDRLVPNAINHPKEGYTPSITGWRYIDR